MEESVSRNQLYKKLYIFYDAHKHELSKESYEELVFCISDFMPGNSYDRSEKWEESSNRVAVQSTYSHWVGHDDTIAVECRAELRLTNKQAEEVPWMEMKEAREEMHYHFRKLPCDGLCRIEKDSNQEGDSWSYLRSWNVVWLIKNLYGMEGVWQLSLYHKECR